MHSVMLRVMALPILVLTTCACAQQKDSCTGLINAKLSGVEITKAVHVDAGSTEPNPYGPGHSNPLQHIAELRASSIGGLGWAAKSSGSTLRWRCPIHGTAIS